MSGRPAEKRTTTSSVKKPGPRTVVIRTASPAADAVSSVVPNRRKKKKKKDAADHSEYGIISLQTQGAPCDTKSAVTSLLSVHTCSVQHQPQLQPKKKKYQDGERLKKSSGRKKKGANYKSRLKGAQKDGADLEGGMGDTDRAVPGSSTQPLSEGQRSSPQKQQKRMPTRTLVHGEFIEHIPGGLKEPLGSGFKAWVLAQRTPQSAHAARWSNRLLQFWRLSTDTARFEKENDSDQQSASSTPADARPLQEFSPLPTTLRPYPPQRPYSAPAHLSEE